MDAPEKPKDPREPVWGLYRLSTRDHILISVFVLVLVTLVTCQRW